MGKYESFADLAAAEQEGRDYRVVSIRRPTSAAIIIAPHGGEIEAGTSEIATMIAGMEHGLFCFEGLKDNGRNRDLRITSHLFDHPECLRMASDATIVLCVHGCKGEAQILIGGLDEEFGGLLAQEFRGAGYAVLTHGHRFPGRHPANICNRGMRGLGAQLEFTYDLRQPEHCAVIAAAARSAIATLAARLHAAGGS